MLFIASSNNSIVKNGFQILLNVYLKKKYNFINLISEILLLFQSLHSGLPTANLKELGGGSTVICPIVDLSLLGQVLGRVDVGNHALDGEEGRQVGGVG